MKRVLSSVAVATLIVVTSLAMGRPLFDHYRTTAHGGGNASLPDGVEGLSSFDLNFKANHHFVIAMHGDKGMTLFSGIWQFSTPVDVHLAIKSAQHRGADATATVLFDTSGKVISINGSGQIYGGTININFRGDGVISKTAS